MSTELLAQMTAPDEKVIFMPCPYCGGVGKRLSIDKDLLPFDDPRFRVQCACGVCGPYGHDTEEAIIIWNGLFTHTEDK